MSNAPPDASDAPPAADEAAPADLAREIAAVAGVHLDGVRIHRGSEVDRRAAESGAAAYAVDDAVHLPSTAGGGHEARALVAHELVHVAQQRRLGTALPEETSTAGAALEAEAVAVEKAVREGRPLPRLQHPRAFRAQPPRIETEASNAIPATTVDGLGPRTAARPIGTPVPKETVTGRVQRRPAAPIHAQPAADPQPATPATPEPSGSTAPTWSGLGQSLANDAGETVLSSWSLEESHDDGRPAQAGADSREDRFKQLARPALDRLNEQRVAAGQDELVALPPEEEARIWQQVDAGVAGGAGGGRSGPHVSQPAPIRSWGQFGTAVGNDLAGMAGDWFGMDGAELTGSAAAKTSTPAATKAAHAETHAAAQAETHEAGEHAEHPAIDTDRLDLDELTARLYDRIRSRLRLELLLDRERAGLLSDFR